MVAAQEPVAPVTPVMFSKGATARRQKLLQELNGQFDWFTYEEFIPVRPGVFVVSIHGHRLELRLGQVEVFVVGLRAGVAATGGALSQPQLASILTHKF